VCFAPYTLQIFLWFISLFERDIGPQFRFIHDLCFAPPTITSEQAAGNYSSELFETITDVLLASNVSLAAVTVARVCFLPTPTKNL